MGWFEELKSEVTAFLEEATKEEIKLSLERANYAFYKDIDVPIIAFHERIHEWIGRAAFRVSFISSKKMMMKTDIIAFEEMTTADNYGYSLAA